MGGPDPLYYMKTVSVELFTFEELPEAVQAKVLNDFRYMNVEHFDWYHSIIENWTERLENEGFKAPDIQFSGFYSQGDGASFTCKELDVDKLIPPMYEALKGLDITGSITRHNSRYVHENTITLELVGTDDMTPEQTAQMEKLEALLFLAVRKLCKEIYTDLQSDYEFQTSDDVVKECVIVNEYTFEKDGTQRNA